MVAEADDGQAVGHGDARFVDCFEQGDGDAGTAGDDGGGTVVLEHRVHRVAHAIGARREGGNESRIHFESCVLMGAGEARQSPCAGAQCSQRADVSDASVA
ncbi:Uncharacterised protein [Mycobacteroides abscessus subsp. abscessus]|nr:Uncharacterised protein [Mycobacteroides abscessus subsp. abscessus]